MDTVINLQVYQYTEKWVEAFRKMNPNIEFWPKYYCFLEFYSDKPDRLKHDLKEVLSEETRRKKKELRDRRANNPRKRSD